MVQGTIRVSGTLEGTTARLRVGGEVDLGSAQALRDAICEALDAGAREIEVDLGAVSFLDSTGLSILLHAARDAGRRGAQLRTVAPAGSEARVVLDLARVGGLLHLQAV
jgi:anti-sigma B factor antagonist